MIKSRRCFKIVYFLVQDTQSNGVVSKTCIWPEVWCDRNGQKQTCWESERGNGSGVKKGVVIVILRVVYVKRTVSEQDWKYNDYTMDSLRQTYRQWAGLEVQRLYSG